MHCFWYATWYLIEVCIKMLLNEYLNQFHSEQNTISVGTKNRK